MVQCRRRCLSASCPIREIPIGQIIVAPNFNLSNPYCYEHNVAMLVLLLPVFRFKPQSPRGTLLPCPLPGGGTLVDSVHQACLLDICIAIGPTGGESLCWVRVHVVVHVGKVFGKGPGLVFGLRRALACALWTGLAVALLTALASASLRAMAFALLRALAFALPRALALALAFGVGHVVQVGAPRPGTEGKLLRLNGLQWVGTEWSDWLGWAAVAGSRGRTPAAWRPAVGGYGEERRPWSGQCGRGPRANS